MGKNTCHIQFIEVADPRRGQHGRRERRRGLRPVGDGAGRGDARVGEGHIASHRSDGTRDIAAHVARDASDRSRHRTDGPAQVARDDAARARCELECRRRPAVGAVGEEGRHLVAGVARGQTARRLWSDGGKGEHRAGIGSCIRFDDDRLNEDVRRRGRGRDADHAAVRLGLVEDEDVHARLVGDCGRCAVVDGGCGGCPVHGYHDRPRRRVFDGGGARRLVIRVQQHLLAGDVLLECHRRRGHEQAEEEGESSHGQSPCIRGRMR